MTDTYTPTEQQLRQDVFECGLLYIALADEMGYDPGPAGLSPEEFARQLRQEVEALRRDAERYRWLREKVDHGPGVALCEREGRKWSPIAAYCDTFVDYAMAAELAKTK